MYIYFLTLLLTSIICLIFGFLIWKKGKYNLINSYNLKQIKDLEAYGKEIGETVFYMGVYILILAVHSLLFPGSIAYNAVLLTIGVALFTIRLFVVQRNYSKS